MKKAFYPIVASSLALALSANVAVAEESISETIQSLSRGGGLVRAGKPSFTSNQPITGTSSAQQSLQFSNNETLLFENGNLFLNNGSKTQINHLKFTFTKDKVGGKGQNTISLANGIATAKLFSDDATQRGKTLMLNGGSGGVNIQNLEVEFVGGNNGAGYRTFDMDFSGVGSGKPAFTGNVTISGSGYTANGVRNWTMFRGNFAGDFVGNITFDNKTGAKASKSQYYNQLTYTGNANHQGKIAIKDGELHLTLGNGSVGEVEIVDPGQGTRNPKLYTYGNGTIEKLIIGITPPSNTRSNGEDGSLEVAGGGLTIKSIESRGQATLKFTSNSNSAIESKIESMGKKTLFDIDSASLTTKGAIHTHANGQATVNLLRSGSMTLGSTNLSGSNASIYSNNATNTITVDNATLNTQGIMVATGGGYANNIINASNGAKITLAGVTGYNPSNVKGRNTNTITANNSTLTIGRMEISDGYKNDRTDKDEGATNTLALTNSNATINGIVKTSKYGKTRITLDGGSLKTAQEIATTEGLTKVTLSNNATLDLKGIFDTYGRGNVIVESNQSTITLGKSNRANRDVSIYANNSDNKLTLNTGSKLTTEGSVFAGGGGIASNTINATGAALNIKGKIEADWTENNKNIINLKANSTLTAGNLEANGRARNELTADNSSLTVANMRATSSAQNVVTLRGNSTFTAQDIYGADGKNIFNVTDSTFKANKLSFSPNGAESSNTVTANNSTLTFAEISTRSNGWHPKRRNILKLTNSSLNITQAIDSDPNGENNIEVNGGKADSKIVTIGKKIFNNYGVNRYGSIRTNAGTNTITLKGDAGLDAKGLLISVGGGAAENIIDATATSGRVTIGGVYTDGANNKNTIKMGNKTLYVNNPEPTRPNFEIVWGKSTIDAQAIQSDSGDLKFELRYGGKLYLSNGQGRTKLISQGSNNFNIIGSDNMIFGADLASNSAFTLNNRSSLEMDSLSSSTNKNIQVDMSEATLRLTKGDSKISTLNLNNGNNVIELGKSGQQHTRSVLTIGQNGQGLVSTKDSNSLTFVSYVNPNATAGQEASKVVILGSSTPKGTYNLKPIYTDINNLATIGSKNIALATVSHKANASANSSAMDKGIIKFTNGTATFETAQGFDIISTTLRVQETNQDGASGSGFTTYYIAKAETNGADSSVYEAISTIAASDMNIYLANFNSLNKRMGELRDNAHSHGVWARVFNGQQSNDYGLGSKTLYTTIQGGYDYAFGFEGANNYLGLAISYGTSNTTSNKVSNSLNGTQEGIESLKSDLVEFALYNAYVQDNGWYNDTIAKFSYIMNSLSVSGTGAGSTVDLNNFAFMFSNEFGYRFKLGSNQEWYIDPQLEVSAGYISGSQFAQNEGNSTMMTEMDSRLIVKSRFGASFGYDFKNFTQEKNLNAKLYLGLFGETDYFKGKVQANLKDLGNPLDFDGRLILNAGTNITIKDNTRLYLDVESSFIGKIRTDYKINVGARYSFGENGGYKSDNSQIKDSKAPLKLEEKEGEKK